MNQFLQTRAGRATLGGLIATLIVVAIAAIAWMSGVSAQTEGKYHRQEQSNVVFRQDVFLRGELGYRAEAVSLTSPTTTFSVEDGYLFVLNSDANQTGIRPTGGELYQEIKILAGAGTNTMRFDDGTSMTTGANKTLTEGQGDTLGLLCVSADGDEWTLISDGSGN